MDIEFDQQHVVVTGGAGALGTAVVQMLLEAGASVSVPVHGNEVPEAQPFSSSDRLYIQTDIDLANENNAETFYRKAVSNNGPLWGSVQAAGGFAMGKIESVSSDDFRRQLDRNLISCYNSCRSAVHWIRKNEQEGGRLVNIVSRPALEPRQGGGMTSYTASKAGVAAFTRSLGAELADEDILVNAVAPSIIDTPANREAMPGADHESWTKPGEIAGHILYLLSLRNTATRGAVIPVYGKS